MDHRKLEAIPMDDGAMENECRAACLNATLLRGAQLGRAFFTAEDARAAEIMTAMLMRLKAVAIPNDARLDAPQTLAKHDEVAVYRAVESALDTKDAA